MALGLSKDYFHVIKSQNPNLFKYLTSLNANMLNAYQSYISEQNKVKAISSDMYFYLQERRLLYAFGKILVQENLSPKNHSFSQSCSKVLFTSSEGFGSFPVFMRYKAYIKEFDKHYIL